MSFRVAIITSIILLSGSSYARQAEVFTGFTFVFPAEPAPKQPVAKSAATYEQQETQLLYAREMREAQIENARIESFILAMRYQRYRDEQPPVNPEKDEYRKYLREKQHFEEDPEYAKMRAPRDDFKAWKESPDYKIFKDRPVTITEPVKKGRSVDALAKALNSPSQPENKPSKEERESDE